jgi:YesN/AraC family two-component response regulator
VNILIVDDEIPAVLGVLKIVPWERVGIKRQYTAYSMAEAAELFIRHPIEILLTDIEMGGGTGFDLIQWVNAQEKRCVSVILSSFPNFTYAQRAITLGVYEYLLKPIEDTRLEQSLLRAAARAHEICVTDARITRLVSNPLIERSKQYIQAHIGEDISRNSIAAHVGFSPEYLSTYFKKETGMTLSDFIKAERVAFAKQLLKQTNLPISMISGNVGFDSLSYFSAVFRAVVGCTPREYRQGL